MSTYPDLTKFKALSFDCYGTLIDWESGLRAGLEPIISRLPPPSSSSSAGDAPPTEASLTKRFDTLSAALQSSSPTLRYDLNLSSSFRTLAAELGVSVTEEEATAFGSLPGTWAPFEDTIPGLEILKRRYKLIILSNIDASNISHTLKHFSPVAFDAVYTAERIGSYKPADGNFSYLFEHVEEEFGVKWDDEGGEGLLHVARSLTADHVPAKKFGLRSVWISRGGDAKDGEGVGGDWEETKSDVGFEWRFDTIGEFAREVERQFGEKR
ncbi:haloacid dehalogenase, type II [Colletotrichum filicis]|nr:haloacid dehalogenase, type II [Colletotrichum filicis]